jgi:hypothetical protein
MNRFLPLLAAMIFLTTACAAPAVPRDRAPGPGPGPGPDAAPSSVPDADAEAASEELPEHTRRAIEVLLREADQAQRELRLTTPADDNALDRYLHVLVLAPSEPRAREGIARIAATYRELAAQAARGGNEDDARSYLDLATQVAPQSAELAPLRALVEQIVSRPVRRIALDGDAVAAEDAGLASRLANLGTEAKENDLFVVIRAPRDDWGRWIYQQMNGAPPAVRLRARSELSRDTLVELAPIVP